jgi:tRNA pseudouridine38-40 synthase
MVVAYHGAGFRGFAENRDVPTVGGALRTALEQVLGHEVRLSVAGRTDAGVHARAQVVSFDTPREWPGERRLLRSLNSLLGPSVAVRSAAEADEAFDARFSATWRRYRYRILGTPVPDPFLSSTTWWHDRPLDADRLAAATAVLPGRHDFSAFCRRPRDRRDASLVREVLEARWWEDPHPDGRLHTFEITATAFCHQMVRAVTGTLVEVGEGRREVASVRAALRGTDRSLAGQLAPARGLTLWEVGY